MAYDKKADPNRVTEHVVRAQIQAANEAGKFPEGFHLVKQGSFWPGGDGHYACVRVVCLQDGAADPDRPFSLHDAVLVAEADGIKGVSLINGDYDLTVEQAAAMVTS